MSVVSCHKRRELHLIACIMGSRGIIILSTFCKHRFGLAGGKSNNYSMSCHATQAGPPVKSLQAWIS